MYNLQKYNVKGSSGEGQLYLLDEFTDLLGASIYTSLDMSVTENLTDFASAKIGLTVGIKSKVDYTDSLSIDAIGSPGTILDGEFIENLSSSIRTEKIVYATFGLEEDEDKHKEEVIFLNAKLTLSKNVFLNEEYEDGLNQKLKLSKDLYLQFIGTDLLGSKLMANIYDTEHTAINITIPPGSVLEIDSENYTVYLNNENVFDSYTGSWVIFDRDTIELTLGVGNGRVISGDILYRERYL